MFKRFHILFIVVYLGLAFSANAQIVDKAIGIKWISTETKHWIIHYYKDIEFTAQKVAAIADSVYDEVTSYHNYKFKYKVHCILSDFRDSTNGFAIYSLDMVNAEATNLYLNTFNLRGRTDWIRNVFAHEFAHIVHGKKGAAFGNRVSTYGVPPVGIQDDDKNKYEIFGLFRLESKIAPYWWVEGIAQNDATKFGFESYDTTRQMFLRMAFLENNVLSFNLMGHPRALDFIYGELGYNQGFSFVAWLTAKYGVEIHTKFMERQSKEYNFAYEDTIKNELGVDPRDLFEEWKKQKNTEYEKEAFELAPTITKAEKLLIKSTKDSKAFNPPLIIDKGYKPLTEAEKNSLKDEGMRNNYAKLSPDGKWISYLSDETLFIVNNENILKKDETYFRATAYASGINSYDWSPDSNKLILSTRNRRTKKYFDGFKYHDLAIFDLSEFLSKYAAKAKDLESFSYAIQEKTNFFSSFIWGTKYNFITYNERALEVAWSPDKKHLAYIKNSDGNKSLCLYNLETNESKYILEATDGSQAGNPSFSSDGKKLAFHLFDGKKQDIWIFNLENSEFTRLTNDKAEDRDPYWSKIDPTKIIYSSDKDGIFNVYETNISTGNTKRLTSVYGGIFMPFEAPLVDTYSETAEVQAGDLLYSNFSSYGFKLFKQSKTMQKNKTVKREEITKENPLPVSDPEKFDMLSSKSYYYKYTPIPRLGNFMPFQIIPEFQAVNEQAGLGFTGIIEDYLSKHKLSMRGFFDKDSLYGLTYINHQWYPEITLKYLRAITTYDLDDINSVLEGILSEDALTLLGLDNNPTELYRSLSQDIFKASIKFPFRSHELKLEYYFRDLKGKMGSSFFGADLDDSSFTDSTDPTGTWGDVSNFRILQNNAGSITYTLDQLDTVTYTLTKNRHRAEKESLINPHGYRFNLSYSLTKTNVDEAIDSTGFLFFFQADDPSDDYIFHSITGDFLYSVPLSRYQALEFYILGGWQSRDVASNDELYLGGKPVFQTFRDVNNSLSFPGYNEFSISGETRFLGRMTYRFPLYRNIDKKLWFLYFDDFYMELFADAGNCWDYGKTYRTYLTYNDEGSLVSARTRDRVLFDAGLNLRMQLFSFYYSPWYSFLTVAYGFQETASNAFTEYDNPIRIYLGLGGGFL
ncbi:MAG: hypothetical protein ABIA04_00190 [Pseudomonadota bacterium]